MIIKLTNAERDTILAALRRWQSYPAAREADSVATNGGKHRPLDNSEIERICKRMSRNETTRNAASSRRQSDNGAHEHKESKPAIKAMLGKGSQIATHSREREPGQNRRSLAPRRKDRAERSRFDSCRPL